MKVKVLNVGAECRSDRRNLLCSGSFAFRCDDKPSYGRYSRHNIASRNSRLLRRFGRHWPSRRHQGTEVGNRLPHCRCVGAWGCSRVSWVCSNPFQWKDRAPVVAWATSLHSERGSIDCGQTSNRAEYTIVTPGALNAHVRRPQATVRFPYAIPLMALTFATQPQSSDTPMAMESSWCMRWEWWTILIDCQNVGVVHLSSYNLMALLNHTALHATGQVKERLHCVVMLLSAKYHHLAPR